MKAGKKNFPNSLRGLITSLLTFTEHASFLFQNLLNFT